MMSFGSLPRFSRSAGLALRSVLGPDGVSAPALRRVPLRVSSETFSLLLVMGGTSSNQREGCSVTGALNPHPHPSPDAGEGSSDVGTVLPGHKKRPGVAGLCVLRLGV